ncbi:hypothetical protein, partial [Streptomyces sp. NPDC004629]|uniref:hypothetical protein n=1 Tax=Streptomyces sp. NPDC004629 TaxID=3364705 RepID=UPI0036D0C9BB
STTQICGGAVAEQDDQDRVLSAVGLRALEYRDELLETAVVLDVLALCHPPGGYLPRPYVGSPAARTKRRSCALTPPPSPAT